MKRMNFTQLRVVIALAISVLTGSIHAVNVALENNYGAAIKYSTRSNPKHELDESMADGERIHLGYVNRGMLVGPRNLFIRTAGKGSSYVSFYKDLSDMLKQVVRQAAAHSDAQTAVIHVSYTMGISGISWNITVDWE